MKTDIRRKTALIVARDGEFLTGLGLFVRWSKSPYDAWFTRDKEAARQVAIRVRGTLMLFNPVAGQIREYRAKGEHCKASEI